MPSMKAFLIALAMHASETSVAQTVVKIATRDIVATAMTLSSAGNVAWTVVKDAFPRIGVLSAVVATVKLAARHGYHAATLALIAMARSVLLASNSSVMCVALIASTATNTIVILVMKMVITFETAGVVQEMSCCFVLIAYQMKLLNGTDIR